MAARVIGDHAAVMHVASPRRPAWHRAAFEQRHVEPGTELHDLRIDCHRAERLQRLAAARRAPLRLGDLETRAMLAVTRAPDVEHPAVMQLAGALDGQLRSELLRDLRD